MTLKSKKLISFVLKIAIVAIALWFIYVKLTENNDLKEFLHLVKKIPNREIVIVISSVILLMLANWFLEAVKWKYLIKKIEPISLWKSIESVFCGLNWAVFTPNRIGEYGGRVFFLSPKRRIKGVVVMSVGTIAQLLVTNVVGAIAICAFLYHFKLLDTRLYQAVFTLAFIFCSLFLIFYFNIKWLNTILSSIKFTRQFKRFYIVLKQYKKSELLTVFLISFGRYLIFSTEYFLMFNWMVPGIDTGEMIMLIGVFFFVQSSIPTIELLDIGVRSATALFFFKYVTPQTTSVVACIAVIWFVNIIIPAILGSYFVFKLNFFGNDKPN